MPEATVKMHESRGSVWSQGDLVAGYERGRFGVLLCVAPREVTERGKVTRLAALAEIDAETWDEASAAIEELGFERPALTEEQVRNPRRRL
jgi:hypothetical protein